MIKNLNWQKATSLLFTRMDVDLETGRPTTISAIGQSGTRTDLGRWIAGPTMRWPLGHAASCSLFPPLVVPVTFCGPLWSHICYLYDTVWWQWTYATGRERKEDGKPCVASVTIILFEQKFLQTSLSLKQIYLLKTRKHIVKWRLRLNMQAIALSRLSHASVLLSSSFCRLVT